MHAAKIALILLALTAAPCPCHSQTNSFDGVTCKEDIAKALLGHYAPTGRVVVTEARYKGIALKNLWAYGEPPDPYRLQAWSICGRGLVLLVDLKQIVRDVVAAPPSPEDLANMATCFANGQKYPEAIVFLRENLLSANPNPPRVRVGHAWTIDMEKLTFTPIKADSIVCE